jgi:hypothetical protein
MVHELSKESIRAFFSRFFSTALIAWLEKEFGVVVADCDLQIGNFNSVSAIVAFAERKANKNHGEVVAR